MVAGLTRALGPAHLDLAEEVVQDALIQALKRWPFHGVPERPEAWLYTVARNLAVDRLRRDASFRSKEGEIRDSLGEGVTRLDQVALETEWVDDTLGLIFLCCHPEVPKDGRVALTLKIVGGFSVSEIARAFLTSDATVAQRIVRAKNRIRELRIPFEVPPPDELPGRLDAALEVLYLLFNEGYAAHEGGALVRSDLCAEALRLVTLLAESERTGTPATHALAALFFFQASRLPARVDSEGNLVLLADQDRTLWERPLIRRGFYALERASSGATLTEYHLQAAIAAQHAAAPTPDETDWLSILKLYDELLALNPSPIVALNRAVALAEVDGPRAALNALSEIEGHPALAQYYLLPATSAELLSRAGEMEKAAASYREALSRPSSEPERRFLLKKLAALESP